MEKAGNLTGRFSFNAGENTWSLVPSKGSCYGVRDITGWIEVSGKKYFMGRADRVEMGEKRQVKDALGERTLIPAVFTYEKTGLAWEAWFEVFRDEPAVIIRSKLKNISSKPLVLGRCCLFSADRGKGGSVKIGRQQEKQTVFVFSGTQGANRVKKITSDKGRHTSQTLFHIYNPESGLALNTSFLTFTRIETEHSLLYSPGSGIRQHESYCDFMGYELMPGADICPENLFVEIAKDPYATLERWADMANRIYKPGIPSKVPAGWLGWAWVDTTSVENYEEVVLRNTKAIRERLKGFDIEYVWISQGNLKDYMPGQWLKINRENFPHFEKMLGTLKKRKFKTGLWIAPFWVGSLAREEMKENRDNFLKKEGEPIVSFKNWPFNPKRQGDMYSLDGSHPKSLQFIRKVFKAYREMGIRYYMLDFVKAASVKRFPYDEYFDRTMVKGPQVYYSLLKEIRKTAGRDTHLVPCSGPTFQNAGIANAMRIAADWGEGRPLFKHSNTYPATFTINWFMSDSGSSTLENMAATYFTHGRLYLNDLNVLVVDKPVSRSQAEQAATIFGISGSPMLLGDDIERMHPERLEMIKKCLPRTSECAKPVDLFSRTYPDDYPGVFLLPLKTKWGSWSICAVFNKDNRPRSYKISSNELNLGDKEYHLYEFWNGEYLGKVQRSFDVHIPAHSCCLYRLEEVKPHPWILSTDMHTLQGYAEIESLQWDGKTNILKGTAVRPAGQEGSIYVIAPAGYRLVNFRGHWAAKDFKTKSLIIRKKLVFKTGKNTWELKFSKI